MNYHEDECLDSGGFRRYTGSGKLCTEHFDVNRWSSSFLRSNVSLVMIKVIHTSQPSYNDKQFNCAFSFILSMVGGHISV